MSDKLNLIVLDRCNPPQNMSQFYVLRIEPSLFGDVTLVREWGELAGPVEVGLNFMTVRPRLLKPGSAGSANGAIACVCRSI
jgi:hypothetical protein